MYHITICGKETGPFTLEELRKLAQKRQVTKDMQVRAAGRLQTALALLGEEAFEDDSQTKQLLPSPPAPVFGKGDEYYLGFGNQEVGPFSMDELRDFAKEKRILEDTPIRLGDQMKTALTLLGPELFEDNLKLKRVQPPPIRRIASKPAPESASSPNSEPASELNFESPSVSTRPQKARLDGFLLAGLLCYAAGTLVNVAQRILVCLCWGWISRFLSPSFRESIYQFMMYDERRDYFALLPILNWSCSILLIAGTYCCYRSILKPKFTRRPRRRSENRG